MRRFIPGLSATAVAAAAIAAGLLSAPAMAAPATARDGLYLTPSIGYGWGRTQDFTAFGVDGSVEYDGGVALGAALGYRFGNVRVEGELGYAGLTLDRISAAGETANLDSDIHLYSGTVSAFYDFDTGGALRPFVGGGVGFTTVDADDVTFEGDRLEGGTETSFAVHGEVGVSFAVSETVEIVPSYRYTWSDLETDGFDDADDFGAHLLRVGVRYSF